MKTPLDRPPTAKRSRRRAAAALWAATLLGFAGCSQISSTTRRAGAVALGATAGGTAGYLLGNKSPAAAVGGAVVGGALTQLGLGEDPSVRQAGFDQGYIQGQSDAIKRQYFLRHAMEAAPLPGANAGGETVYYVMPGPEVTVDGRKLEPHEVAVRVVE